MKKKIVSITKLKLNTLATLLDERSIEKYGIPFDFQLIHYCLMSIEANGKIFSSKLHDTVKSK